MTPKNGSAPRNVVLKSRKMPMPMSTGPKATILQLAFGLLAFVGLASKTASGQFFDWLLAFSALIYFFSESTAKVSPLESR